MIDKIMLCHGHGVEEEEVGAKLQDESSEKPRSRSKRKGRGKKQPNKEVVDLRALLTRCAQSVAASDHRSANELLKQIRQHSSPRGDANQRVAHWFADGLQARLAGTGSEVYRSLVARRIPVTDILRACQLFTMVCPFKKISNFFTTQTILNVAKKATKLHIIDFGTHFGFQWPCFLQRLSTRHGGPPKVRMTGIDDVPLCGFRPTELINVTGRRLADYARSFGIPFEFRAIAAKWDAIRPEDLRVEEDEVVVVNCSSRMGNLMDESVAADSPRDAVLSTIRRINPAVFIHGVTNGTYGVPFFLTRLREALFHFSSLFDMIETNLEEEEEEELKQVIERALFGREALNVVACEGAERAERPETYKQWQARSSRAGLTQLPLNRDNANKAAEKVKSCYNEDFVVDEDGEWLLQGWKGRIIFALSTWKCI